MTPRLSSAARRVAGLPRCVLLALVRGYRIAVSPALPASCRFVPTCSAYALEALERHGAVAGSYLAGHRVLRCGPWCDGGHDPVPDRVLPLFGGVASRASPPPSPTPIPPP